MAALPVWDYKAFLLLRGLNSVCPEMWYALFGVLGAGLASWISDFWLKDTSEIYVSKLSFFFFLKAWKIIAILVCADSALFRLPNNSPMFRRACTPGAGQHCWGWCSQTSWVALKLRAPNQHYIVQLGTQESKTFPIHPFTSEFVPFL